MSPRLSSFLAFPATLALVFAPLPSPLSDAGFPSAAFMIAPALADEIDYGKKTLIIHPPSGFVDSRTISDTLFQETRDKSGLNGVLLKVYLPDPMAQQYAEGRLDTVTRQVVMYGWSGSARLTLDKKNLELAAKTLEGAYASYPVVPEDSRKKTELMTEAYRNAAQTGTSLLVEVAHGENSITYVNLLNYPMSATPPQAPPAPAKGKAAPSSVSPGDPNQFMLTTALSTSLVLVNESIVYVTASSIVTDGPIAEHIEWVTYASEAFADMLVSANKN